MPPLGNVSTTYSTYRLTRRMPTPSHSIIPNLISEYQTEADSTHDMTVTNNNQSMSPLTETEMSICNMTEYNVALYSNLCEEHTPKMGVCIYVYIYIYIYIHTNFSYICFLYLTILYLLIYI
jgi:hypothetical protein